ncbi:MAG TPA: ATP-dependent DNA helicase RecQ [Gemmatimonadales bacterium]|nr:ATP-dependent DNA helicase RecQ [Gemmatimonadales bacterium]
MTAVHHSLRRTFGIDQLRQGQDEVIHAVLNRRDTLAIMPTGAGKSLCYQLPALHLEGTTVIVSPLISLMKDQVDKLQDHGLDALQLNSAVPAAEQETTLDEIEQESSEFVFTTPERLTDSQFLGTLRDATIDFVVIDEAHCISQWGHDFRPAYLALQAALKELGNPPVLALTATATANVVADIKRQLGRPAMRVVNTGIYRPNLWFEVEHVSGDAEKQGELLRLLEEIQGDGIIYAATVKHVEEVTSFLQGEGYELLSYHGRLNRSRRKEAQDRFMAGELEAIVATNAFGMGIDRPDIRFVIHYDLPGSLESYYQEAGRAGRDGEEAWGVLLYDRRDRRTQLFMLGGRYPTADQLSAVYAALVDSGSGSSAVSTRDLQVRVPGVARTKTRVALSVLKEAGVVQERRAGKWSLAKEDVSGERLVELAREWKERSERDHEKLERVEAYARSALCRWRVLHDYFQEPMVEELCGVCDNCRRGLAQLAERPVEERKVEENGRKSVADAELRLNVGDEVSLPRHGTGRIEEIDEATLVVRFPDGTARKFRRDFARPVSEDVA